MSACRVKQGLGLGLDGRTALAGDVAAALVLITSRFSWMRIYVHVGGSYCCYDLYVY